MCTGGDLTLIAYIIRGGIVAVTKHIVKLSSKIEEVKKKDDIDFPLYNLIANMNYGEIYSEKGNENNIFSFATKFLSFTRQDVYPVMDHNVKHVLEIPKNANYEFFYNKVKTFRDKCNERLGTNLNFKELDMFLWQLAKHK